MAGKMVDEGENRNLDILYGSQAVDSTLYLGLYTDTTEPAETATLASITEVAGTGYERQPLTRGSWTVSGDQASYAQQEFTAESDWGSVYGYFIASSSDDSGKLLYVEHFGDGPYGVTSGKSVKVTPKIVAA